ncbi:MAG TPA: rhodanese-like domain-containing protein [Anaerolineales bacterium]|nr:rhodanese-like domain-containing protein [Anaerolineales bacterium]
MTKKHHTAQSTSSGRSNSRRHRKHNGQNRNWLWIGLGIFVLIAIAFLYFNSKQAFPTEISVAQAHEKYQQGALFVDVRTQEEWDQMHIANSTLIPLNDLQGRLGELPRDRDIVVVCKSGVRSKEGVAILRQAGFTRATCMSGGIQAWTAAGYPVVQ